MSLWRLEIQHPWRCDVYSPHAVFYHIQCAIRLSVSHSSSVRSDRRTPLWRITPSFSSLAPLSVHGTHTARFVIPTYAMSCTRTSFGCCCKRSFLGVCAAELLSPEHMFTLPRALYEHIIFALL